VQQYNAYIRKFPAVLTAKLTGAKERKYFTVTNADARGAPKVDFDAPATSPTPAAPAPAKP
jgi:LemA protein